MRVLNLGDVRVVQVEGQDILELKPCIAEACFDCPSERPRRRAIALIERW